jgi:hypothetical protein
LEKDFGEMGWGECAGGYQPVVQLKLKRGAEGKLFGDSALEKWIEEWVRCDQCV